jgi:hypothetical protein
MTFLLVVIMFMTSGITYVDAISVDKLITHGMYVEREYWTGNKRPNNITFDTPELIEGYATIGCGHLHRSSTGHPWADNSTVVKVASFGA